jgi:hypothetical protein
MKSVEAMLTRQEVYTITGTSTGVYSTKGKGYRPLVVTKNELLRVKTSISYQQGSSINDHD